MYTGFFGLDFNLFRNSGSMRLTISEEAYQNLQHEVGTYPDLPACKFGCSQHGKNWFAFLNIKETGAETLTFQW